MRGRETCVRGGDSRAARSVTAAAGNPQEASERDQPVCPGEASRTACKQAIRSWRRGTNDFFAQQRPRSLRLTRGFLACLPPPPVPRGAAKCLRQGPGPREHPPAQVPERLEHTPESGSFPLLQRSRLHFVSWR